MKNIDFLYIRVHGMPCVNRCRHCWLYGAPGGGFMDRDVVFRILDEAAGFKSQTGMDVFPQFFMEPSIHPDFTDIMGRMWDLGLTIGESTWVSTNGHGIAAMSDPEMERLAETGVEGIRFTVYGLREAHDEFAGRRGAWDDIRTAAMRCDEYGIDWLAGILMTRNSVNDYHRLVDDIGSWGTPCVPAAGWFVPQWDGRARDDEERITIDEVRHLLKEASPVWKSESEHIRDILADEELASRTATYGSCRIALMDVFEDMSVHYGGGCDSSPFADHSEELLLGDLRKGGFLPLLEKSVKSPPECVRVLAGTTWGELAERYGDPSNRQVFYPPDLVINKWGRRYLKDILG